MTWFWPAAISALLLGFYDVCKKQSLKDNAVIPVLFLNTLISSLIFAPFLALSAAGVISPQSEVFVPPISLRACGAIAIKSLLVLSSWFFGYIGIKHLPLSLVGPINAMRPVLVLAGAVFIFSESLNILQWCGVVTAIAAFCLLSRAGKKKAYRLFITDGFMPFWRRASWGLAAGCTTNISWPRPGRAGWDSIAWPFRRITIFTNAPSWGCSG